MAADRIAPRDILRKSRQKKDSKWLDGIAPYRTERAGGGFSVGLTNQDGEPGWNSIEIYVQGDDLCLVTDEYEGYSSVSLDNLPGIRWALAKIAKRLRLEAAAKESK